MQIIHLLRQRSHGLVTHCHLTVEAPDLSLLADELCGRTRALTPMLPKLDFTLMLPTGSVIQKSTPVRKQALPLDNKALSLCEENTPFVAKVGHLNAQFLYFCLCLRQ